jgi:hypothetical protein
MRKSIPQVAWVEAPISLRGVESRAKFFRPFASDSRVETFPFMSAKADINVREI